MENQHWKNEKLFDDRPLTVHRYIFPNVVELRPLPIPSEGHDDTFDHWKNEVIPFPTQEEPPNIAA